MDRALVSVIIPVYNAEDYLEECLNSVIKQSYYNLEILIVDDGSLDSSLKISQSYSVKDKRIQVIKKKKEGVSKARNLGIHRSRGQFIFFVDADDYIEKTFVEKLVWNIEKYDIAVCGYVRIHGEEKSVVYRKSGSIPREELFSHTFCSNLIGGTCWNKIYKSDIIKQNKLHFDETISIGEDMLFLAEYYKACKSAVYVGEALYFYRCNPKSALQHSYINKQFDKQTISCLEAAEKFGRLYENDTEMIWKCVAYRKVRSSLWLLYQMIFCEYYDKDVLKKIREIIRHNYRSYRKSSYGTRMERWTAAGMCIVPRLIYYIGTLMLPCFKETKKKYLT